MKINRRNFLIVGGFGALGAGMLSATKSFGRKVQAGQGMPAPKWALAVDLQKCWAGQQAGCHDCLNACNKAHNIPQLNEAKDEIKWIWLAPFEKVLPGQQHDFLPEGIKEKPVVTLCNHCDNPPCVRVCPTKATFKSAEGVVTMDYHRCIGCRYCMAACPYGARSFNFRDPRPLISEREMTYPTREKGVVEKCNFCAERLEEGLRPSCVEACSYGALIFGDLSDPQSEVREILRQRYSLQRKPQLGTDPKVYYLI